jgi:hypothetical protein
MADRCYENVDGSYAHMDMDKDTDMGTDTSRGAPNTASHSQHNLGAYLENILRLIWLLLVVVVVVVVAAAAAAAIVTNAALALALGAQVQATVERGGQHRLGIRSIRSGRSSSSSGSGSIRIRRGRSPPSACADRLAWWWWCCCHC